MKTRKSLLVLGGLAVVLAVGAPMDGLEYSSDNGWATSTMAAFAAEDGQLTGRVTDSGGNGLAGFMVSAKSGAGIEITVFTDGDGRYSLTGLRAGEQTVTAKGPGWLSAAQVVATPMTDGGALDFKLTAHPNPGQDLSGAHWMDLLPDGDMKHEFMINCVSCHQMGHARVTKDGQARDESQWAEAIALMRSTDVYGLTPPDFDDAAYAKWLAENLTAERAANITPPAPVSADVSRARYTEYPVPSSFSLPHDLVIGPDRRIWVTGFFNDVVWAYQPITGAVQSYNVNATPDTLAQVRALEFDGNGDLWILNGGTSSIVKLDIKSGSYETYDADMYAHSLDLDSQGNIWVNDYFGKPERIGVVDARTGKVKTMPIPSADLSEANGLPLPYGLQVDQMDRLWVTMLAANTLVRYDTRTGDSKLYQMPTANSGPRRLGIGPDGIVWIPEFATGKLARFDPETESFTEYDLGSSAAGPYDVEVDQKTGIVWVSGSNDSSIFRFDPETESVTRYPWPTERGFIRHIAVDEETGDVWATYSSYPPAAPKLVRLQPNG